MTAGWVVFWVAFSFFLGAFVAIVVPLERARTRGPWDPSEPPFDREQEPYLDDLEARRRS